MIKLSIFDSNTELGFHKFKRDKNCNFINLQYFNLFSGFFIYYYF